MNKEENERRCKACGKLLIDEKVPFCRRCILEGRNKVGQVGGIMGGMAMMVVGANAFINDNSNSNNDTSA